MLFAVGDIERAPKERAFAQTLSERCAIGMPPGRSDIAEQAGDEMCWFTDR